MRMSHEPPLTATAPWLWRETLQHAGIPTTERRDQLAIKWVKGIFVSYPRALQLREATKIALQSLSNFALLAGFFGIAATIRIGQEMFGLLYAGFFFSHKRCIKKE